jgi:hypothetical protein
MASARLSHLDPAFSYEWSDGDRQRVLDALGSDDAADRRRAAELAGSLEPAEVASELLRLLRSDPDAEVRGAAAIAFGPMLETAEMAYDEDEMPVDAATMAEVRQALRDVHENAAEPDLVRRKALEAAVRSPDKWMAAAARSALTSTDPLWRMTGVFAAGYLEGLDSLVVASLGDEDPGVRIEAVRAAATGMVEEAIDTICAWARSQDTERELRIESVAALAHLPGSSVTEILDRLSGDRDGEIAEVARMAQEEHEMWAAVLGGEE